MKDSFAVIIIILLAIIAFCLGELSYNVGVVSNKIEDLEKTVERGMDNITFAKGGYSGFLGHDVYGEYFISGKYFKDLERAKEYAKD